MAEQCDHVNFIADCKVHRLTDADGIAYRLNVSVKCEQCGIHFKFVGLEPGFDPDGPTTNKSAEELRIPISPK